MNDAPKGIYIQFRDLGVLVTLFSGRSRVKRPEGMLRDNGCTRNPNPNQLNLTLTLTLTQYEPLSSDFDGVEAPRIDECIHPRPGPNPVTNPGPTPTPTPTPIPNSIPYPFIGWFDSHS